jgi:hypothetical protein
MLEIIKEGIKNFTHRAPTYEDYGANDLTIIFDGNNVKLRSLSGRVVFDKDGYVLADVRVYDIGGAAETFATIEALRQRLIDLGYPL